MKKYYVILNMLGLCFFLVAGIWFGMLWQNAHMVQESAYEEKHGTDIAVVNQDLGIPVDGETINYANAVIETLGSDYTVVSLSAAETGLENGTYGAMVTFPTNFSENILSINRSNPEKAILDLVISKRLPEDSYVSLYTQLISMEQQVNNNMAYTYVESMFKQLHFAQDDVKELLANDETDMKAVEKVRLAKYIEMLDLGDIPKVEFNPDSPDFEALLAKVQTIADDMNQVYVDSYAAAQEDFSVVQKQISDYEKTITEQSAAWITAMNAWSGDVSGYKAKLDEWRIDAEKYRGFEKEYYDEVEKYKEVVTESLNGSKEDLDKWKDESNLKIKEVEGGMDTASIDINTASSEFLDSFNTDIDNLNEWIDYIDECQQCINDGIPLPSEPTCNKPLKIDDQVREDFSTSIEGVFNVFRAKVTEIPNVPDVNSITPFDDFTDKKQPEFIDDVPDAQSGASPDDLPSQSTELTEALDGIVKVSAGYNPDDYLNEDTKEKAQQNVSKYATHLEGEKAEMEAKNSSNLGMLNSAHQKYNTHVGELRMKITEVHTKEQENLAKNITALSDTLKKTSKANHVLMDSFVDRMPNSRNESTVNQEVVEATVTPITYSYDYIRVQAKKAEEYTVPWLLPLLIALILAMILVSLIIWIKKRKRYKEIE